MKLRFSGLICVLLLASCGSSATKVPQDVVTGDVGCATTADCDDGNICTTDTCVQGQCTHEGQLDLACDDGNSCTHGDLCTAAGECSGISADVGSACNDSNCCTSEDACVPCDPSEGLCDFDVVCVGQAACEDDNECTVDQCSCDAEEPQCTHEIVPDETECTLVEGMCTADSCQSGTCVQGPSTLDDNNPCTDDLCDDKTGIVSHAPKEGECSDGNPCTLGDICASGHCAPGGETLECDDNNPCTSDTCNTESGGCDFQPVPTGVVCSGENTCKLYECQEGFCVGYQDNDGALCDDSNECTGPDLCASSVCSGSAIDCEDGESCTENSCDPATGCSIEVVTDGSACDDLNACNENDRCENGVCVGFALDCDDNEPCTADSCDIVAGCQNVALTEGDSCEDGNECTENDFCTGGVCAGGVLWCDDGSSCTLDSCDPDTGCQVENVEDGTQCADLGDCKIGVCDTGDCIPVGSADQGAVCDDGDFCTLWDRCNNGECEGQDDVCVETMLGLAQGPISSTSAAYLGLGDYGVHWTGAITQKNAIRVSNRDGSRLEEKSSLSLGGINKPGVPQAGRFSPNAQGNFVVTFTGDMECPSSTNCSNLVSLIAREFNANGVSVTSQAKVFDYQMIGPPGLAMKIPTTIVLPRPGGWALIEGFHSTEYETANYEPHRIRYHTLTADLLPGNTFDIVGTEEPFYLSPNTIFDARSVPGDPDSFYLVYVADGGGDPPAGSEAIRVRAVKMSHGAPSALTATAEFVGPGDGPHFRQLRLVGLPTSEEGLDRLAVAYTTHSGSIFARSFESASDDWTDEEWSGESAVYPGGGALDLGGIQAFSDGGYVVPFSDSTGDAFGSAVFARLLNSDGSDGGLIQGNTMEEGEQTHASVATFQDAGDDWVMVFADDPGNIWARGFERDGTPDPGRFERPLHAQESDGIGGMAAVAGPGDTVMVVYATGDGSSLRAQILNQDGSPIITDLVISEVGFDKHGSPAIIADDERYYLAWAARVGGGIETKTAVYLKSYHPDGSVEDALTLVEEYSTKGQKNPALALHPWGDRLIVSWDNESNIFQRVYYKGGLDPVLATQQPHAAATSIQHRNPDVIASPDGNGFLIAWEERANGNATYKIMMAHVDNDGTPTGEAFQVNSAEPYSTNVQLETTADESTVLVFWDNSPSNFLPSGLFVKRVDLNALLPVGSDIFLHAYGDSTHQSGRPDVITMGTNKILVAAGATKADDSGAGILVQRVKDDTSTDGPFFVGNRSWLNHQEAPFLVRISSTQYLLGWKGPDATGLDDIFVRSLVAY